MSDDSENAYTRAILSAPGLFTTAHHPTASPSDADIDRMVDVIAAIQAQGLLAVQLVFTYGPALSANQRKRVSQLAKTMKHEPRVAVVSGATLVRGAVTALSWLGVNAKAFAPADLSNAIAFLGCPVAAVDEVVRVVRAEDAQRGWDSSTRLRAFASTKA